MKSETTSETQSAAATARLRALFNEKKGDISQEEFGATYEIGSQGMIWQYLNGRRPLNLKAAIGFARGLGVALEDISPEIAEQVATASSLCGSAHSIRITHDGLPAETDFQKLPGDVTAALQSVLSAFRKGDDIRNSDLRAIVWYALTPVESGMIGTRIEPASADDTASMPDFVQQARQRAADGASGPRTSHVEQQQTSSKRKRRQP